MRLFHLIILISLVPAGCTTAEQTNSSSTPVDITTLQKSTETTASSPVLGDSQIRSNDDMTLVYVPAGEFLMGSNEEEVDFALHQCKEYGTNCQRRYFSVEMPTHIVVLDSFWVDKTEVTNSQYQLCEAAGICDPPGCQGESQIGGADHPVVCVTWHQATEYCEWVGARLPAEAEWEYAARGAEGIRYPWGDEFVGTNLNYCDVNCAHSKRDEMFDDGYTKSAAVGSFPHGASWVGALDMAGNVWEMVADWNSEYPSEKQINPTGPSSGGRKVARGGSWHASPDHVRSALRTHVGSDDFVDHAGFRCAQSLP
jgi:serine/threonine-protein kinase